MKTLAIALAALLLAQAAAPQSRQELAAEYAKRYRALDKKDVTALLELADWSRDNKLMKRAERLYRRAASPTLASP